MENRIVKNYTLEEIDHLAKEIVGQLVYPICTLEGNLGAGKTTLLKAICKHLGVKDEITSPTYSIVQEYETKAHQKIYHFDLYRIKQEVELYDFGFSEFLNSGNRCFIEWPKIGKNFFPIHYHQIIIEMEAMQSRSLVFK
jgi:tRNA threonylcarbamoyladenosine biosynthesis protein TsaE